MPYDLGTTTHGSTVVYDSGDYPRLFDGRSTAWATTRCARRKRTRAGPDATSASGSPTSWRNPGSARGSPRASSSTAPARSSSHTGIPSVGQGVETVLAQVCADILGVRYEDVTVRYGDTDALPDSVGAFGSRGTVMGGNAVRCAAERVRDKILAVAARGLEAHPADLELRDGAVHVRGVADRALSLREVARAAAVTRALPAGLEPGLEALHYYGQRR